MNQPRVKGAFRLLVGLAFALAGTGSAAELSRVIDVGELPIEQARQGAIVTLRGTVVFVEPGLVFLQDDSGATYFRSSRTAALRVGDEVEVTGRTDPGIYVPGLDEATFRVIGRGEPPPAIPVTYDDLFSGRYYYQRVEVEGVVRSVNAMSSGRSLLRLASTSRVIDVWVDEPIKDHRLLVGSLVSADGVAVGSVNRRRQLVQAYVRTPDWNGIRVVRSAIPDAEVPRISAAELLTHRGARQSGNRVRLQGVVAAVFPPRMAYLRTEPLAFAVRLATPVELQEGDAVEFIGFPEMGRFSGSLVDARLIDRRSGPAPEPFHSRFEELYQGKYEYDLVAVTGVVIDTYRSERQGVLVLQEDERRLRVVMPSELSVPIPTGSRIRATGIARVNLSEGVGYSSQPEDIMLNIRDSHDLEVISLPSWWTAQRLSRFVAILAAVTLLAVLWIMLLRRQVRRQAAAAKARIESEAALEERHRLAREFHDALEQELVGLGLRLDAVGARSFDEQSRSLLQASRSLVSRIQSETRNLISDLRDPTDQAIDLVSALEELKELNAASGGVEVDIEVGSALPSLPVAAIHNLRMIARESVTNALKHSRATRILVRVEVVDGSSLVLAIIDNGCGFDVVQDTAGKSGHFGCVGIRERAAKLNATVDWSSSPGRGTTVRVVLPLAPALRPASGPLPALTPE